MRLIFLGTGGYHPNERRHTACLLLPEAGIAFDAGTGFFRVQSRLETEHLDVFLSHAHLDHVCGLTFFLVPVLTGQVSRVRVHGTAQTLLAVREHLFAKALFPVDPPYEWQCIDAVDSDELPAGQSAVESAAPGVVEVTGTVVPGRNGIAVGGGGILRWTPLEHPGGAVGYRIDWADRSLAYITDTTAPGEYLEFIRNVDVLVHECYFPDTMEEWARKTGHSFATAVAQLASDADVGRLVLVHADPQCMNDDPIGLELMRAIFPATELAEDLGEVEF